MGAQARGEAEPRSHGGKGRAVRHPVTVMKGGHGRRDSGPAWGRGELVKVRGCGGGPVRRLRRRPSPRESVLERSPAGE